MKKAKQIQEDLLDLWKNNPEDNIKIIAIIYISQSDVSSVFSTVFSNFQRYSLPHLHPRNIINYYIFLRQLGPMYAFNAA